MTFIAKLRKHTLVWKQWRHRRTAGGTIEGVLFKSVAVGDYESAGPLGEDEIRRLRAIDYVDLVVFGGSPELAPVEAQEPPVDLRESKLTIGKVTQVQQRRGRG